LNIIGAPPFSQQACHGSIEIPAGEEICDTLTALTDHGVQRTESEELRCRPPVVRRAGG
jgi:hypothetical protein